MRRAHTGQVAIEFLLLTMAVFAIFALLFVGALKMKSDIVEKKEAKAAQSLSYRLQKEIMLAYESHEGYERNFILPAQLRGKYAYNLSERNDYVAISTAHTTIEFRSPPLSTSLKGNNVTIQKHNGTLHINAT